MRRRPMANVDGQLDLERPGTNMLPLYHKSHFTFRFADDRIIPRFHLESIEVGRHVAVYQIDSESGVRLGLLAKAVVGEAGWVGLPEPIIRRRTGGSFLASRYPCFAPPGYGFYSALGVHHAAQEQNGAVLHVADEEQKRVLGAELLGRHVYSL